MSTDMLEDIHDISQYHPSIHWLEVRYKICGSIKQRQMEWKGALLSTQNMGKVLHKLFKAIVNDLYEPLPILGNQAQKFLTSFQDLGTFQK